MAYLSMSLGLSGPMVRMIPVGEAILRRQFGEPEASDAPSAETVDAADLAQLRALPANVTSEDVPGPGPSVVYH